MSSLTSSYNLPLLSIPTYYALASAPHAYAAYLSTSGNMAKYDNRSPHSESTQDRIKKSLGPRNFAAYERAIRCHQNALENMPLFVAAVFAGLMAERSMGVGKGGVGLENFVIGWFACRVVYSINYCVTESTKWSYLRSAMYMVSTGLAFRVIGKAAYAIGA